METVNKAPAGMVGNYTQCSAKSSRSQQRCRKRAISGGRVCRTHGGGAPQVKRKAALRLIELIDPAIATIARVMTDQNAKPSDRLRAAENVLDRAGVPRSTEVTNTDTAQELLVERLITIRDTREAEARTAAANRRRTIDIPREDYTDAKSTSKQEPEQQQQ